MIDLLSVVSYLFWWNPTHFLGQGHKSRRSHGSVSGSIFNVTRCSFELGNKTAYTEEMMMNNALPRSEMLRLSSEWLPVQLIVAYDLGCTWFDERSKESINGWHPPLPLWQDSLNPSAVANSSREWGVFKPETRNHCIFSRVQHQYSIATCRVGSSVDLFFYRDMDSNSAFKWPKRIKRENAINHDRTTSTLYPPGFRRSWGFIWSTRTRNRSPETRPAYMPTMHRMPGWNPGASIQRMFDSHIAALCRSTLPDMAFECESKIKYH